MERCELIVKLSVGDKNFVFALYMVENIDFYLLEGRVDGKG
ncbi:MAG: hypothetical protein QW566_06825 [Candidatus Jordarchaeales archaeon]